MSRLIGGRGPQRLQRPAGRQLPSPKDNGRHFPPHQRLSDSRKWREGGPIRLREQAAPQTRPPLPSSSPAHPAAPPPPPPADLDSHICADTAVCPQLLRVCFHSSTGFPSRQPVASASSTTHLFCDKNPKRLKFVCLCGVSAASEAAPASRPAGVHGSCAWNEQQVLR